MTDTLHARTNPVTGRLEVVAPIGETVVSEYADRWQTPGNPRE